MWNPNWAWGWWNTDNTAPETSAPAQDENEQAEVPED